MSASCCLSTDVKGHIELITINNHTYKVTIIYCASCGSLKALSNIKHEK